jgi:hypothetical protein
MSPVHWGQSHIQPFFSQLFARSDQEFTASRKSQDDFIMTKTTAQVNNMDLKSLLLLKISLLTFLIKPIVFTVSLKLNLQRRNFILIIPAQREYGK